MSDAIARLSATVAADAHLVPEGLKAKVELVLSVNGFDLMTYLSGCYKLAQEAELLEASNDSQYTADLSTVYDSDRAEVSRTEVLDMLRSGGIEVWRLRPLLMAAHLDGHLPQAKYVVSVSW